MSEFVCVTFLLLNNKMYESYFGRKIPDPLSLCAHFRLVQMCERHQQDGNLEGIDALLGKSQTISPYILWNF